MINRRKKLEEYKKILQERYETLVKELMGREADYENASDRRHGCRRGTLLEGYVKASNISDSLKVRMAVEDFKAILAEIKKLAAK